MAAINVWVGGVTDTSILFKVRSNSSAETMKIAGMEWEAVVYDGVATFHFDGLKPNTKYPYSVGGITGEVKTFPKAGEPATFSIGAGSCSGQYLSGVNGEPSVSNGIVFKQIRDAGLDLFVHMGDMHYRNIKQNNPALFEKAFDDVFAQPNQHELYRNIPQAYMWDDHDFGDNDSVASSPSREAAIKTYRKRVPSYPLSGTEGVWQTWVIGRVRFVMTDQRSYADDPFTMPGYKVPRYPEKTMLGKEQLNWFRSTLRNAKEELLVWINTVPWHTGPEGITSWGAYEEERATIVEFLKITGWTNRMVLVSGDWHGMGMDSGLNNKWGEFPVYHFAPIDANPSSDPLPFPLDVGSHISNGHWGHLTFIDSGSRITVKAKGMANDVKIMEHSYKTRSPRYLSLIHI